MVNGILTTSDLKAITAYERVGDIRRCLEKQGIRYFWCKDGVWTTLGLIEAAKLGVSVDPPGAYPADIL